MKLKDLKDQGNHYLKMQHPDSALGCYAIIINSWSENLPVEEKRIVANAYNNSAYTYFFYFFDSAQAYSYLVTARKISESIGYDAELGRIWLNMGNIFSNYGDISKSNECYRKGLSYSMKGNDRQNALASFMNLVSSNYMDGGVDRILPEISKIKEIKPSEKIPLSRSASILIDALETEHQGDLGASAAKMRKAMDMICADTMSDPSLWRFRFSIGCMLGKFYQKRSDSKAALSQYRENTAYTGGDLDLLGVAYANLSEAYLLANMPDSAEVYKSLAREVTDSLYSTRKYGMMKDLDKSYELGKMNEELRSMAEKRRTQQLVLVIVCIACTVVFVLLMLIISKERRLRRSQEELYKRIRSVLDKPLQVEINEDNSEIEAPLPLEQALNDESAPKYRSSPLQENDKDDIGRRILKVLESEEIFSPDFSLDTLASISSLKNHYISQVVNEKFGKNFNTLLAERRIMEACRRLGDIKRYGNLTIEAVALGIGFKSRSHFSVTFKRHTGLTPGEYMRMSRKNEGKKVNVTPI